MGSSCFSRGNSKTLNLLNEYIGSNGLGENVSISGSLCEGRCSTGPHITINEIDYDNVTPESVLDLLKYHLNKGAID